MSARVTGLLMACLAMAGCQSVKPYDYTNYRAHPPRSILVLPPLNESTDINATYGYLSTVTLPIAELGYYVFPVAVVDEFLKENGMPSAGEMHSIPLDKVVEIIGADAVMFITLKQYGSQFHLLSAVTVVEAHARLVDARTGTVIWEGHGQAQQGSGGSGNILADIIAAAVVQAINSKTDPAHNVSRLANVNLLMTAKTALPYGPYSPNFGKPY